MEFRVGQKVVFRSEVGGGVIKSKNAKGLYVIEDEDGFDRTYRGADLAHVQSENYQLNDDDVEIIREEAEQAHIHHVALKQRDQKSNKQIDVWEIDLHIEQLVDSHRDMSNTEIVRRQMNAFKVFLNKAQRQNIRKLIIIHGVGEGVLKYEVREYLDGVHGASYYDSDYMEYGKGATTVELRE